jgi:hypothetical protein
MGRLKLTMAMLLVVPLAFSSLACGDDRERQALADDELERDLDLAFQRDTVAPTFGDIAIEGEPDAPEAQPTPPQTQTQQPRQAQPQPRPTQPTQPAPTAPQPRTVTMSVPSGTTLAIRMNEELSTERSQAGDAFTATLSAPLVDAAGIVLVPAGATVRGRVTAVAPSTRVGQTATMNLAFESISFGGQSYPLHASVERADVQQKTRTSAAEQAGKIAAGAAAGAILGQVIGRDRSSTIRGAAVGAAAGTAIAMGTADVDAVLPAGAEVVIRLDQPIQVTRTVTS